MCKAGRYRNASEVLREGLRLIEERERLEVAKLKALKQAARQGWADVAAGRYADVADEQLEDFIGQMGRAGQSRSRGNDAFQGGTGKKNPNRIRVGISSIGGAGGN